MLMGLLQKLGHKVSFRSESCAETIGSKLLAQSGHKVKLVYLPSSLPLKFTIVVWEKKWSTIVISQGIPVIKQCKRGTFSRIGDA